MARILVVDDDAAIRDLVTVILADEHEVTAAQDGAEALELLESQGAQGAVDAVVLDVMMPKVDGFEVLRRLRARRATRELPIIMLTARSREDDHLEGFSSGADAYITKPFEPSELATTVAAVLARTPEQRAEIRDAERARASLLRQVERRFD